MGLISRFLSGILDFFHESTAKKTTVDAWSEYDQQQSGTVYWDAITNPQNAIKDEIIRLLRKHQIADTGKEFIMCPDEAIRLIQELQDLGVAVSGVGVWCLVPVGKQKEECCPDGMGGPATGLGWFREYVHLWFWVPNFDNLMRDLDLAKKCNPLVIDYIKFQLPQERGFNEHIHISPDLYVPLAWNLFPDKS